VQEAILRHNPHWKSDYKNLVEREVFLEIIKRLDLRQITVLTGIRRSGKTTLFKLIINYLIKTRVNPKSILYINLDDPYFSELYSDSKNLYKLLDLSHKITGVKIEYLFLDEVQNVEAWEKFVKSLYDNEITKKIFVTGSNATLLDSEYAILLSGRYLKFEVMPPSFSEVLRFYGILDRFDLLDKKVGVLKIVDELLEFGSFFEVLKEKKFKRDIILSYYDTIVFKDCIANSNIRDSKSFRELLHFYISNVSNSYSYNSISRATGINDNTVKEYIKVFIDSYLCSEILQYSYSLKSQIKQKKRAYCIDNGFLAQTSFRFSKNYGKLFENLVFSELKKAGAKIYFYNDNKSECDFICKMDDRMVAVQVCYELNAQNRSREFKGLEKLTFNIDEKVIITYDQNEDEKDIKVVAFWDYFSKS
jgi:predicted AAA+ superfamily ATPase